MANTVYLYTSNSIDLDHAKLQYGECCIQDPRTFVDRPGVEHYLLDIHDTTLVNTLRAYRPRQKEWRVSVRVASTIFPPIKYSSTLICALSQEHGGPAGTEARRERWPARSAAWRSTAAAALDDTKGEDSDDGPSEKMVKKEIKLQYNAAVRGYVSAIQKLDKEQRSTSTIRERYI